MWLELALKRDLTAEEREALEPMIRMDSRFHLSGRRLRIGASGKNLLRRLHVPYRFIERLDRPRRQH